MAILARKEAMRANPAFLAAENSVRRLMRSDCTPRDPGAMIPCTLHKPFVGGSLNHHVTDAASVQLLLSLLILDPWYAHYRHEPIRFRVKSKRYRHGCNNAGQRDIVRAMMVSLPLSIQMFSPICTTHKKR